MTETLSERKRRASKTVKRRTMASSPAILAAREKSRIIMPVMVKGVELARTITVIPPRDFKKLNLDETYQRLRIGTEVNDLIHVLSAGGQIPDPIDVAERPDGTWWIVDGQQRYWAHSEVGVSLRANIHKVEDLAAETKLFLTLNARRKVTARTMAKGWPGISGDFLRKSNADAKSPVVGLIDMGNQTSLPLDATTVIKGILAVTTGILPNGEMSRMILPRTDAALKVTGMTAWAESFLQLVAAVFDLSKGKGRVRVLPVIALARVAHKKYAEAGRPIFPSTCAKLRRVNWDTIVPTHAGRYLPLLEQEIERRWK